MPQQRDNAQTLLRCAVPIPVRGYLDYLPVNGSNAVPVAGGRILIPLGSRQLVGVVTEILGSTAISPEKLKCAKAYLDDTALIDSIVLELLGWTADYYQHPPGETLILGLSPRERRGEPPASTHEDGFTLTLRGEGLSDAALSRAPRQQALIAALRAGPKTRAELRDSGFKPDNLRALITRSLIEPVTMLANKAWSCRAPLTANTEQSLAITHINASLGEFSCHLLEGVTGSGKTEVYLQAIAAALARQEQTLVLIPEIGLTPQLVRRFNERFDAPIVTLHSGLGNAERDRNWQAARSGQAAIIIGTRSAVFAPMLTPGLIIVDEEHDVSLSQQDGLRYSARDVAVKRAQLSGCPIVLGSATPSLESMANATNARYRWHRLTQRAAGASPPTKHIVDIRGLALRAGLSPQLQSKMTEVLSRGEQVLLFLNRRGFAPTLLCHDCGWTAECQNCDARQTLHKKPPRVQCHHCGQQNPLPKRCPECQGHRLVASGLGTEQTEQALRKDFPKIPVHRVDSDSMSGRHAMATFTQAVEQTGACIMLGTQLLAKGHHFPKVTCVGILDADSLLMSPDFRGEERLAQLLTQVGGRAGRAQQPGEVIVQTRHPEHPIMTAVLEKNWRALSAQLLLSRKAQGLPPNGALAALRCDSANAESGSAFLLAIMEKYRRTTPNAAIRLVGPLSAPMARRAGLYRSHIVITGPKRSEVHASVKILVTLASEHRLPTGLRWFVDIDPSEPL